MSGSIYRRSKENVDDDDESDEKERKIKRRRVLLLDGCKGGIKKAKRVFKNAQKLFTRITRSNSHSPSSCSHSRSRSSSKKLGSYCCCLCISQPQTLDATVDGVPKNGPDDPEANYEYLKSLIEKNDFYCKECNTHIGD